MNEEQRLVQKRMRVLERRLPRQVDTSKVEFLAFSNASAGVNPPRLSGARAALEANSQGQVISLTSSRFRNSQVSKTSFR